VEGVRGFRRLRVILTAVILSGLLYAVLEGSANAEPRHPHVLVRQYVVARQGAAVRTDKGVELYVPAGVMRRNGYVTITAAGAGRYDLRIAPAWQGKVRVTLPLRTRSDAVLHYLGNVWVPEGKHRGQGTVWVGHLSLFSSLSSKVAGALCLSWSPAQILKCLALKLINKIDKSLALWIAEKISHSCVAAILASIPGNVVEVSLTLFKAPACVGNAVDGPPGQPAPAASPPPKATTPSPSPSPAPHPTPPPGPPPPPTPTFYVYHVFGTCADGACGLHIRSGPGYSAYAITGTLADGDEVDVVCQALGEPVGPSPATGNSSAIWDQLTSGGWASDLYITTPNVGTWSPPIPRC
jgi:hypothetical protein